MAAAAVEPPPPVLAAPSSEMVEVRFPGVFQGESAE